MPGEKKWTTAGRRIYAAGCRFHVERLNDGFVVVNGSTILFELRDKPLDYVQRVCERLEACVPGPEERSEEPNLVGAMLIWIEQRRAALEQLKLARLASGDVLLAAEARGAFQQLGEVSRRLFAISASGDQLFGDAAPSMPTVARKAETPIPMRIYCPKCAALHVDLGEWSTKPHTSHTCQCCGHTWQVALVPTVGVRFLPGTKIEEP